MAVRSSSLGAVKISGEEAQTFARKITYGRGTKAASESAKSGKVLADVFAKTGYVTFKLQQVKGK